MAPFVGTEYLAHGASLVVEGKTAAEAFTHRNGQEACRAAISGSRSRARPSPDPNAPRIAPGGLIVLADVGEAELQTEFTAPGPRLVFVRLASRDVYTDQFARPDWG